MLLLALLWVLAGVAEGMLYADRPLLGLRLRLWLLRATVLVGLITAVWLSILNWRLWLAPNVLELYRLINASRFLRQRLPLPRLNSVALRAHLWLTALQTMALIVDIIVIIAHGYHMLLVIIMVLQLFSALMLLRSSLHTWRHSKPYISVGPLTDKELPSLSVLIPARNETDTLERCLELLIASDYPKLEIVVLDDNSTIRRTPEIIRSFAHAGVRFIQGAEPDESRWLAKNQAYARLRHEASGELLLFCGVDVQVAPDSLRQLVSVLRVGKKDMLSVLPLKDRQLHTTISLLQPMRYYWELCLPRRFFKRPPVLSTCWLIRAAVLDRNGGFEAVSRTVTPEAYFARQAVVNDAYSFIRSSISLGISSIKPIVEQYDTSVRMRYPQLHRRLELVAFTSLVELGVFLGPIVGLCMVGLLAHAGIYIAVWSVCVACLLVTYYLAAVATKLNNLWLAWALMPFAFLYDVVIQHVSLYKYEFSHVEWKGRDVARSVMQAIPQLPKL